MRQQSLCQRTARLLPLGYGVPDVASLTNLLFFTPLCQRTVYKRHCVDTHCVAPHLPEDGHWV
jgi:hypothetical protein